MKLSYQNEQEKFPENCIRMLEYAESSGCKKGLGLEQKEAKSIAVNVEGNNDDNDVILETMVDENQIHLDGKVDLRADKLGLLKEGSWGIMLRRSWGMLMLRRSWGLLKEERWLVRLI